MSRILILTLLSFLLLVSYPAQAQTTIGCSVDELLNAGSNVINLAPGCTYTFTSPRNFDATKGNSVWYLQSDLTINGNGATLERASDAFTPFRLFRLGHGGSLTLNDVTIRDGYSDYAGGAIYALQADLLSVNNSTFVNNSAVDGGGAIYSGQTLFYVTGSTFSNNTAYGGGGIEAAGGSISLINSVFFNNHATRSGGAVELAIAGDTTVINTIFSGNTAGSGGGMNVSGVGLTVSGSLFAGNYAYSTGGGLSYTGIGGQIVNSTFSGNFAGSTAGAFYVATTTLANVIVWGNSLPQVNTSSTINNSIIEGGWTGAGTGNLDVNPLFVNPIGYENAPTIEGNYRLKPNSPAINMGNNAALPLDITDLDGDGLTNEPLPYDLDNLPRIVYDTVDMGAYESRTCENHPSVVNINAGDTAGLVEAVICSNQYPDENTINLTESTYTFTSPNDIDATYGDSALPRITTPVIINGNGAIIERTNDTAIFRLLTVKSEGSLVFSGGTITGGFSASSGGGILNQGDLTLIDSTITDNQAEMGNGGGIANVGNATLTVIYSTITNNSANGGGGLYNQGIGSNTHRVKLMNSWVTGNAANGGGGIQNINGTMIVTNTVISGNGAIAEAGGILNDGGHLMLINSTISGNKAGEYGGVVILDMDNYIIVFNSIISGNSLPQFTAGAASINNSIIEGGWTGVGTGNLDVDPMFVNPISYENAPTADGDYRLKPNSPAINAGSNATLPLDTADLDGDGMTNEPLPYDLDNLPRIVHDTVDIGAYESRTCENYPSVVNIAAGDTAGLVEAVICSNQYPDENIINLAESAYTFTSGDVTNPDSALPRITTPITINGNGAIIERASDADTQFRLFYNSGSLMLNKVTVRGGHASGGGGIYSSNGMLLRISDSVITDNIAGGDGGGIYSINTPFYMIGTVLSNNTAGMHGGGAEVRGGSGFQLIDNIITNNTVKEISGSGMNVAFTGTASIINTVFSTNTSWSGDAALDLTGSGSLTIVNSLFVNNVGRGLELTGTGITLNSSTISGNSNGGIRFFSNYNGNNVASDMIIWGNNRFQADLGYVSLQYSIIEGGYTGTGNLDLDPKFVDPENGNYRLQPNSPAIDAGNDAALPLDTVDLDGDGVTDEPLPLDLDNLPRIVYDTVDMGAYESRTCENYPSVIEVDAGDTAGLVEAVICSNQYPDENTINLTESTYTFTSGDVTNPDSALPRITTPITINGNGAIIERTADATTNFRLVYNTGDLTLNGLTLRGGFVYSDGGAIYNIDGALDINHNVISDNRANNGGGIAIYGGSLTIADSTISNNKASSGGGGIYSISYLSIVRSVLSNNVSSFEGGGLYARAGTEFRIMDSTFSENISNSGEGGGIYLLSTGQPKIINTTFSGNEAMRSGAIEVQGGGLQVIGSLFSGNNSLGGAGAITATGDGYKFINDTFAGNFSEGPGALGLITYDSELRNLIAWGNHQPQIEILNGWSIEIPVNNSIIEGGWTGAGTGNLDVDPMFVNPISYENAPTTEGDYHLKTGSPAINMGSNAALTADLLYDLDGNPRILFDTVDMGAYEWAGAPGLIFDTSTVTTGENGTDGTYTVRLTVSPKQEVTVTLASSSDDITVSPQVLTFDQSNWNQSQLVTVSAVNNSLIEGTHFATIIHTVASTDPNYSEIDPQEVTVEISDNDDALITFEAVDASENTPDYVNDVTLNLMTNPPADTVLPTDLMVDISAVPGANTETEDFQLQTTSILFPAGSHNGDTQPVTVTITDDHNVEAVESFTLQSGDGADQIVTITDNDTVSVTFETGEGTTAEGDLYTVNALVTAGDGVIEDAVSLPLTVTDLSTTPADYTVPASVVLNGGSNAIEITTTNDVLDEDDETFTLNLSDGTHTITITDNDTAGVTVSEETLNVIENGAAANYTVVLTSQPTALVTINIGLTNEQVIVSPESLLFDDTNWNQAQTVTVTAVNDALLETTQTDTITHTITTGDTDYQAVTVNSVAVTIEESTGFVELLRNRSYDSRTIIRTLPDKWARKNLSKDRLRCNTATVTVARTGPCAFMFVGTSTENALLFQNTAKPIPSGAILNTGVYYRTNAKTPRLLVRLFVYYTDSAKPVIISRTINTVSPTYTLFALKPYPVAPGRTVKKIRLLFNNRAKSGVIYLDDASMGYPVIEPRDFPALPDSQ